MKVAAISLLFLLVTSRWLAAALNADGAGFFPLVVIITTESGSQLPGATVLLEDAGTPDLTTINDREVRRLAQSIGQPVETDARGATLLFYYGRWASGHAEGKRAFSRQIRGRVVVHAPGFERFERSVAEAVGKRTTSESFAPVVHITLKRTPAGKSVPK